MKKHQFIVQINNDKVLATLKRWWELRNENLQSCGQLPITFSDYLEIVLTSIVLEILE